MLSKTMLKSSKVTFHGLLFSPFVLWFLHPSTLIDFSIKELIYNYIFSGLVTFSIYYYYFNRIEKRKNKLLNTFLNDKFLGTTDTGPR